MKKYLSEMFGTMFLVLLACGSAVLGAGANGGIGVLGVGICFGLVLICLAYALGNVSGCHVNPAVSFAMLLSGRLSAKDFVAYVCAQMLGAAMGGALLYFMVESAPDFNFGGNTGDYSLATNVLQPGATASLALFAEVLLTMFFVFVILLVTDEKKGAGNFAGLAIGIALGLVNIVGIAVDNCSVNPARSFGPALFCPEAFGDFWIMVVGPLVGAGFAVLLYKLTVGCDKCKK